ncbi:hypothetical protein HKBW3S43_02091, partial [Candidatus Hakubella thermalkaliphila]
MSHFGYSSPRADRCPDGPDVVRGASAAGPDNPDSQLLILDSKGSHGLRSLLIDCLPSLIDGKTSIGLDNQSGLRRSFLHELKSLHHLLGSQPTV